MLILDTGAFVAATLADDPDHAAFAQLLADHPGPLVTCEPVITEAAFLIDRIAGTEHAARFISELATSDVRIEPMAPTDLVRIADLLTSYIDLRLGFCDAAVIALAERIGATNIATVDHRDFAIVRPRHTTHFTLLP